MVVRNFFDTTATVFTAAGALCSREAPAVPPLPEVAVLQLKAAVSNAVDARARSFITQSPRIVQTTGYSDLPDQASASLSKLCAAQSRRPGAEEREWQLWLQKDRRSPRGLAAPSLRFLDPRRAPSGSSRRSWLHSSSVRDGAAQRRQPGQPPARRHP